MSWIVRFYRSALGKKAVMAVTGVFLFGWIFLHMTGNLKLFLGAEKFNDYGSWLRSVGAPMLPETGLLWITRVLLIVAVLLHIVAATQLTVMSRNARPIAYNNRTYVTASYASRTLRWGGVIILLFVIYHLMHLTFGNMHPEFNAADPYRNVVLGFLDWRVSAAYIVANLALGFHLYHGLWSMFNSLGLNAPKFNPWRRHFATAFALIITIGNVSFPLAVMLGIVR